MTTMMNGLITFTLIENSFVSVVFLFLSFHSLSISLSFLFCLSFFLSNFLSECFSKLETDCIHCGHRCWLRGLQACPKKLELKFQPKKKTFVVVDSDAVGADVCKMSDADQGTGALYIIMDAIRRKKSPEIEEKG